MRCTYHSREWDSLVELGFVTHVVEGDQAFMVWVHRGRVHRVHPLFGVSEPSRLGWRTEPRKSTIGYQADKGGRSLTSHCD